MKKINLVILLLLICSPLYALNLDEDGRTTKPPLARPFMVIWRGVVNLLALPMEIPLTLAREGDMHPKIWPITYVPRLLTNVITRTFSAANDLFFFPWATPFTDDLSPWTEPMGLPMYPWQYE